jgi:hypothetical protein
MSFSEVIFGRRALVEVLTGTDNKAVYVEPYPARLSSIRGGPRASRGRLPANTSSLNWRSCRYHWELAGGHCPALKSAA